MGNRAFIQIESERLEMPIILYGHWSGEDNLAAVQNVLGRTGRIGDPSYLVAQIFYEFACVLGQYDGELSFGIECGHLTDSVWADTPTVYVNADNGEYVYNGESHSEFAKDASSV
jgi:hypothetical protein